MEERVKHECYTRRVTVALRNDSDRLYIGGKLSSSSGQNVSKKVFFDSADLDL